MAHEITPTYLRRLKNPMHQKINPSWEDMPEHPDAEQYERIPLLCYKADQRITNYDLWKRAQDQEALIANELEIRLTGKII